MEYVRLVFADLNGCMKGKMMTREAYDAGVVQGSPRSILMQDIEGVESTALQNFSPDSGDEDLKYRPIESTFCPAPGLDNTYQVVCDIVDGADKVIVESPRAVLEKIVNEYTSLGLSPMAAIELEFYVVKEDWQPFDTGEIDQPYGDMNALQKVQDVVTQMLESTAVLGLRPESALSESGPGQLEINFSPLPPLEMADKTLLFKQMIREVARTHGLRATFLAKPFAQHSGSGSHVHLSLYKEHANIFEADGKMLKSFVNGLVKHTGDVYALYTPNPNSYRRIALSHGYVPHTPSFGVDDRRAAFRQVGSGQDLRIENRIAGSDANPYLQLAAFLACGLKGLRGHDSSEPASLPAYHEPLPADQYSALARFSGSEFTSHAFGGGFVKAFEAVKKQELSTFQGQITAWERETFGNLV